MFLSWWARLCIYKNSLVTGDFVAEEELITEILGMKEQHLQVKGFKAVVGEIQSIAKYQCFVCNPFLTLQLNVIYSLRADQHC